MSHSRQARKPLSDIAVLRHTKDHDSRPLRLFDAAAPSSQEPRRLVFYRVRPHALLDLAYRLLQRRRRSYPQLLFYFLLIKTAHLFT